eukprot:6895018-Prymnesium_polylepis.1
MCARSLHPTSPWSPRSPRLPRTPRAVASGGGESDRHRARRVFSARRPHASRRQRARRARARRRAARGATEPRRDQGRGHRNTHEGRPPAALEPSYRQE